MAQGSPDAATTVEAAGTALPQVPLIDVLGKGGVMMFPLAAMALMAIILIILLYPDHPSRYRSQQSLHEFS